MAGSGSGRVNVWPLTGRDQELQQVTAARLDSGCATCVIRATAGVGKSRLAREAMAAAQADGLTTLWSQATASSSTIPLGALANVIPDQVRSDDPFELMRRTAAALRAQADGARVLLVVDDAQLLDPVSATLVLQLAVGREVFVLATVRSGEPAPDAVESLWQDDGTRRVELGPLSDEAIVQMLETGLGGPVEQATAHQIVDICAGNPLYARELVSGALEEGRLRRERGLWRHEGQLEVTSSVRAMVTRRIGTLQPDLRRLVELLALGEPLRLDEISAMTSYDALEAAEERGMIVISGPAADAEVRVAHPLYGEVTRAELPVIRARAHRLELAEVVQRRLPLTDDDALRVVRWLVSAGAEIPSALLVGAAEAANLAGDPALGADLARRAIDAGAGLRAVLILARSYVTRNRFEDAAEVLAAAEGSVPGDPDAFAYLQYRSHVLEWALRRTDEAGALLDRAAQWFDDPAWAARIAPHQLARDAFTEGFEGRLDALREIAEDPALDLETREGFTVATTIGLLTSGQVREAERLIGRLRPRPPLRRPADAYALGMTSLVGEDGSERWKALDRFMRQTMQEAVRVEDHQAAGFAALTLASLAIRRGRYRQSERWLAEAEVQLEQHDAFGLRSSVAALRVGIGCFTGDPAVAQEALATMRRRMDGHRPHLGQVLYIACGEGWAARALGDRAGAEAFMSQAQEVQDLSARSRLLHEALRSGGRADEISAQLSELAGGGDSEGFQARAAHAAAVARRDAAGLLDAGELLHGIGYTAAAVDACLTAARLFLDEGRRDSARRAALRAQELHPRNQGWELPVVDGLEGVSVQLTAREAQVAALAGKGLSSAEIAEQLVLSVRTVETYVYRAMQKRGVTTRTEL